MQRFFPPFIGGRGAVALLLLRVAAGAAFVLHGWPKIQNPLGWMGAEAPVPGVLQALAAVAEFGGGLAWIAGALTPLASLGLVITMAVAAVFHISRGDPFVGREGSYELALVYLATALLFLLLGPGTLSADAALFRRPPAGR